MIHYGLLPLIFVVCFLCKAKFANELSHSFKNLNNIYYIKWKKQVINRDNDISVQVNTLLTPVFQNTSKSIPTEQLQIISNDTSQIQDTEKYEFPREIPTIQQSISHDINDSRIIYTNSTYSPDHRFLLVLFTSEEGMLKKAPLNTLYMFNLFQQHFDCRCIVYTTTPEIIEKCNELHITTSDTDKNPYNLPYIGGMYERAKEMFNATFYGYINADILVSTNIFDVLEYMRTVRERDFPNRLIELCDNSYNAYPPTFSHNITLGEYDKAYEQTLKRHKGQRGSSSVDMFILSDNFQNWRWRKIVIARSRVDAYMMHMVIVKRGVLLDTRDTVKTIHQGLSRYTNRAKHTEPEDYNWNVKKLGGAFAKLSGAYGFINKTENGYVIDRHVRRRKL